MCVPSEANTVMEIDCIYVTHCSDLLYVHICECILKPGETRIYNNILSTRLQIYVLINI